MTEKLLKEILYILDVKGKVGCDSDKWEGLQNGKGQEIGKDIDKIIKKIKKVLNEQSN
jgi:hypothetical protein